MQLIEDHCNCSSFETKLGIRGGNGNKCGNMVKVMTGNDNLHI